MSNKYDVIVIGGGPGGYAAAFAAADVVVEGRFSTQKIYHAQMEPKSCVCRPEPDGGLTVWPTTQSIHNVRILLGEIFRIPLSKVNVKRVPVGGTFGSSIQMNPPIPICAALALKAGRPVRLRGQRRPADFEVGREIDRAAAFDRPLRWLVQRLQCLLHDPLRWRPRSPFGPATACGPTAPAKSRSTNFRWV